MTSTFNARLWRGSSCLDTVWLFRIIIRYILKEPVKLRLPLLCHASTMAKSSHQPTAGCKLTLPAVGLKAWTQTGINETSFETSTTLRATSPLFDSLVQMAEGSTKPIAIRSIKLASISNRARLRMRDFPDGTANETTCRL